MRNRTLWLLLISNATASVGTGVAMIAIPWLLASQEKGNAFLSVIATIVNIALFLATPLIGPLIDQSSRRSLMIWLRMLYVIGVCIAMGIQIFLSGAQFALIFYYVLGSAFYAINVPLRSAYVQELFEGGAYLKVNAILEIENQVAAAITGIVAIFAIEKIGMNWLMVGNIVLYAFSILCLMAITPSGQKGQKSALSYFASLSEGIQIATRQPSITFMLAAASLPYVIVILFTVMHPTAIANLSGASGSTYALVEFQFALGAILGGLCVSSIMHNITKLYSTLLFALVGFTGVVTLQAMIPTYWGFVSLAFGLGLGNAIIRILRQALLMQQFANHEAGRMNAFLQGLIMLERAALMASLSSILRVEGSDSALWFLAAQSALAPLIFITMMKFSTSTSSPIGILPEKLQ